MYTIDQVNAALRRFLGWSKNDGLREGTAQLLQDGELEVAAIVDGEFVWRLARKSEQPNEG